MLRSKTRRLARDAAQHLPRKLGKRCKKIGQEGERRRASYAWAGKVTVTTVPQCLSLVMWMLP